MLKNKFEIEGKALRLYLDRRNKEPLITTVDLSMMDRLLHEDVKWCAKWDEDIQSYYAQSSKYYRTPEGIRKSRTLYLHKFVLDYNGGNKVDHINHDTLDNRIDNLRISLAGQNSKNRHGANSNNKSGYRNVCWNKQKGMWMVQLQIEGKNTRLGHFNDVHEAGKFAKEMRERYYGDYKGFA